MKSNELQSGMMLMSINNCLNVLVKTPEGFIVVDSEGSLIPFNKDWFLYAYLPKDYDDNTWEEIEGTRINFK